MQDHGQADACAQMLGIGGDGEQGLTGGLEQDVIDHGLVVIGDIADGSRQGEHDMVVLDGQQIGLAGLEPALGGTALAFWTVPVTTGVVSDLGLVTVVAAQHMSAQRGAAAAFNGRHDLELTQAQVTRPGLTPCRPKVAEDIRDFQRRPGHTRGFTRVE